MTAPDHTLARCKLRLVMHWFDFGEEAHGVVASGQFATGVVAFGQVAYGVVAVGQAAFGLVAIGQLAVGGFTLGMGVAFNMFTAVWVTRWVFQVFLELNWLNRPLKMMRLIGVPKIDWMGKRYFFWVISASLLALAIGFGKRLTKAYPLHPFVARRDDQRGGASNEDLLSPRFDHQPPGDDVRRREAP